MHNLHPVMKRSRGIIGGDQLECNWKQMEYRVTRHFIIHLEWIMQTRHCYNSLPKGNAISEATFLDDRGQEDKQCLYRNTKGYKQMSQFRQSTPRTMQLANFQNKSLNVF